MFEEKNVVSTVREGVNLKDLSILNLKDMAGEEIDNICGFIINTKGKYEPHPLLICEDKMVSLPAWTTKTFESFTIDEINAIKAGKMKLVDIHEVKTSNGTTYTFRYADVK